MSGDDKVFEARRWLRYAEDDLEVVRLALEKDPPLVGPACFHSQQAAEKAIKAALMLEGIVPPFQHDLRILSNLLPDGWPAPPSDVDLQRLTTRGAASRYPGVWPESVVGDAIEAEAEARAIYDPIAAEFARRGVTE